MKQRVLQPTKVGNVRSFAELDDVNTSADQDEDTTQNAVSN